MLVELDDDLIEGVTPEDLPPLELLLQSRRLGYHLLTGRRQVFAALARLEGLSDGALSILNRSRRKQSEKGDLIRSVSHRVRVSRMTGPTCTVIDGVSIATVPLSHFTEMCAPDRTVILGENLQDARLAAEMAKVFRASAGLPGVRLQSRTSGGGGSTTAEAFRQFRDDPRFCVCVVDSDRVAPEAPVGDTAKKVMAEERSTKPWAIALVSLCRAAENAIPTRVVEKAVSTARERLELIPAIEELEQRVPDVRDYVRFKGGTRLKDVFALEETPSGSYWERRLGAVRGLSAVKQSCIVHGRCGDPGECACCICPDMGEKLLDWSLSALEKMTPHKISESLCEKTRPHWEYWGRVIFSWTCGRDRTVV